MAQRDCSGIAGYQDPNFANPGGPHDSCIIIYGYTPSVALCALALVLFALGLIGHIWLLRKYRTWYFSTIVIGTIFEIVGYIARTFSSKKDPYSVIYFVIQYFFIVTAPVFYSAAIYTLISIMGNRIGNYLPVSPKVVLWVFVVCDTIATIVQIMGAGLVGSAYSNRKDPNVPNHILLAGLAFQVFSFAVFILCFSIFLWRSRRATSGELKVFSAAVFVATLAVYLRTCFRLAETAEGLLKNLSTHEVFFGCLEFMPIIIALFIFLYWHPGRFLGSKQDPGRALEMSEGPKDSAVA